MTISPDKLKGIIPDGVLSQIADTAVKFNITSNLRLSHFLSQCDHESGGFVHINENLNYSADALVKLFSKHFDVNSAVQYARQAEKIANRLYANRMGNGDEGTGDGWSFHGRGYIQLTGRDNYSKFSSFIGVDCVASPDLVASTYPLSSAAFFFDVNGIWEICDKGSDNNTVTLVTKRVNGGVIGLDDRIAKFNKYFGILGL